MTTYADYSLRALERADLEMVLAWRNSDRVRAWMYRDELIGWEEHEKWFKRVSEDSRYDCQIVSYRDCPIGLSSASEIDRENGTCIWGLYIGDPKAPSGSGLWLGCHALNHMFDVLGMRKVICEVLAGNERAIRLYKKLGFVQEGCLKRHVLKNGRYQDVLTMALFVEDWQGIRAQLERKEM